MATAKFKGDSPYRKPSSLPPAEDYIYRKYLEDLALQVDERSNEKVRVALFGVGRAGTIHLASVLANPRAQLVYIVDNIESKWENIRKYWNLEGVTFLTSKESSKVYKDLSVDAVIVASPTFTHEEIVAKSLEAKKAVFCEKPLAQNRPNTAKCYETAAKAGKPLFCAFNRRFDPSYSSVRTRIRKGEIGHVHMIKTVARDSPLPSIDYLKHSGGIFQDCMVHDIDLITWILGEYPNKVSVQAHAHIPEIKAINDYDTVAATLYFPSGTLAIIDISRNASYGYDQRLEAFGQKGMIQATNEQPLHCVSSQINLSGITSAPIWYSFASRFMNGYREEFNHFLDIIVGKTEPLVKPKETLAVSKVASALEQSCRSGKIVEIKWLPDELPYDQ